MMSHQWKRRSFLKCASSGVLSFFISGILPLTSHEADLWIQILDVARFAPSPHNMQPWRLRIVDRYRAELLADRDRLLPQGDPQTFFMTGNFGLFIDYMDIVAREWGYGIQTKGPQCYLGFPEERYIHVCDLILVPNTQRTSYSSDMILSRRTSRLPYNGEAVDPLLLRTLDRLCTSMGHRLFVSENPAHIQWLSGLNQWALFDDLRNRDLCEELDHLFRYSHKEEVSLPFGLSARCMGFRGSLLKKVLKHGDRYTTGWRGQLLRQTYLKSFCGTPCIAWVRGPWKTPEELFISGQLMGRLWLEIEKSGHVMQPMGSLITHPVASQRLEENFSSDGTHPIWLIMRLGRSEVPPRSQRQEKELLIKNNVL